MHDPTHGGRVHREMHIEDEVANAIGDALAESAWPGVFASGKQIVGSESHELGNSMKVLRFEFSDGSKMSIVGAFEVRYKQPPRFGVSEDKDETQRILQEHGRELMSGNLKELDAGE